MKNVNKVSHSRFVTRISKDGRIAIALPPRVSCGIRCV